MLPEPLVFYAIGSLWGILSNNLKAKSPTLAHALTIAVWHTKSGSQIDEDTHWQATKPPNLATCKLNHFMLEPVFQNSTLYRQTGTFTRTIRSWIHRSPLVPASNPPPLFFFSNLAPDSLGDSKQRPSWFCDKRVQNSSAIFTIIPKFVGKLGTIKPWQWLERSFSL